MIDYGIERESRSTVGTVITIENLPGRFYLFRTGRFSGAGWRYGQVLEKGGFDAKMT